MKVEAGRRYIDTMGAITTPLRLLGDTGTEIFFSCEVNGTVRCYTAKGKYFREWDHSYDLVAEYKESEDALHAPKELEIIDWGRGEDDEGTLPLLNIFRPIRTIHGQTPAKFLARADDGSYLFEIGDRYNVWRVNIDDVDDQFENVPDETRAVVRMYKNKGGKKFFVWGSDTRSPSALATCELTYSDEEGWRVRDLKGEEK